MRRGAIGGVHTSRTEIGAQSSSKSSRVSSHKALIAGGLDAAAPYMTPEKLASMKSDMKQYGEDSFKQFLEQMRSGLQGEARRKLIAKIEVKGEHAVLEARDRPSDVAFSVVPLVKTKNGWKIDVRR